jgi:hypothetical protein
MDGGNAGTGDRNGMRRVRASLRTPRSAHNGFQLLWVAPTSSAVGAEGTTVPRPEMTPFPIVDFRAKAACIRLVFGHGGCYTRGADCTPAGEAAPRPE